MAEATVDIDTLPPTQYLILDVLAARRRLGEQFWTFPDRLKPAVQARERAGLVWARSGPAPNAFQVWPTAAFQALMDASEYRTPTVADGQVREQIRRSVGRDLLRCYGTASLDELRRAAERAPSSVSPEVVRRAEGLTREDERAAEAMGAHASGIEP